MYIYSKATIIMNLSVHSYLKLASVEKLIKNINTFCMKNKKIIINLTVHLYLKLASVERLIKKVK